MQDFVHLHVHTQYSLLDGQASVARLVDKAMKNGMKGIAVTDHGNMFGIKEFTNYVNKKNSGPKGEVKDLKKRIAGIEAGTIECEDKEAEIAACKAKIVEAENKLFCVILVHGSGPHDRDETIGPNKPFRDLAWGLAERGIAVVRYEKRTKAYGAACVPAGRELDYDTEAVDDAVAIVEQVRALPELAPDSVYVLGHSLGGTLAPRIAGRSKGLAGIIILAGLARPLEDALEEQFYYKIGRAHV